MAKAEPKPKLEQPQRRTLGDLLDRFLIIGGPIKDDPRRDDIDDDDEFRLKPGWTIKG